MPMSEVRSASTQKRRGKVRGKRRRRVPRPPRHRKGCSSRGRSRHRCRTGTIGREVPGLAVESKQAGPKAAVAPSRLMIAKPPRRVDLPLMVPRNDGGPGVGPLGLAVRRRAAAASPRPPASGRGPEGEFGSGGNRRPARPNRPGRSVGSSISDSGSTLRWRRSGRGLSPRAWSFARVRSGNIGPVPL